MGTNFATNMGMNGLLPITNAQGSPKNMLMLRTGIPEQLKISLLNNFLTQGRIGDNWLTKDAVALFIDAFHNYFKHYEIEHNLSISFIC